MSLYSISGISCEDCDKPGYIGGKRKAKRQQKRTAKRTARRTARKAKRTARRTKRQQRKSGINCKGAKVKAVALAPARNAYLALIRLNVKKLAVKLAKVTSTPAGKQKLHERWCKLGGDGAKLQSAIDKAFSKYKRKRGIIGYMDFDGTIGVASVATLLATATPIITALAPLVKQFAGGKTAEAIEAAEEVAEAVESEAPAESESESGGEDVGAIGINPWFVDPGLVLLYFLFSKRK